MANNYNEIMKIVNQGNKMGLSNTITRDNGIPLDLSSVQESYNAAVVYAATKAIAYQGQLIAAEGVVYIIVGESLGQVTIDGQTYENYLKPVGTIPGFDDADNGTLPQIKVDAEGNRTLEWVAISAIVEGDGNSVTTLVALDKSITIADTAEEGFEGHKYTVKVNISAEEGNSLSLKDDGLFVSVPEVTHPEYAIAKDERADGATETKYHLTKDGTNVDVEIVVPDAYNDEALAGRVKDLEDAGYQTATDVSNAIATGIADKADKATTLAGYGITDAYTTDEVDTELAKKAAQTDFEALKGRVDAFLDGTGTEAALDSLQELITYINTHDDVELSDIIADVEALQTKVDTGDQKVSEYVAAAIDALKIGDYAKAADLTTLAGRVDALEAIDYATKDEVKAVDDKFANYTTTEDLNNALAGKADDADLANYYTKSEIDDKNYAVEATTLAGYGITDAYTKTEIDNKIGTPGVPELKDAEGTVTQEAVDGKGIFANAYSKAEVNALLDQVSGGSSETAASVKRQLDEYKTSNNDRVAAIETQVGKDVNGDEPATGLFLEVDQAKAQADKGVADAKAASDAVTALASGAVATNTGDISAIKGRLTTLETAKGDHETRLGVVEGKVNSLEAEDVKINKTLGEIAGQITALQGEDSTLVGLIAANTTEIGKKANAADVYTKDATDTAISEAVKDKITAAALDPYAKTEDVAVTYATIAQLKAIYAAAEGDTPATGLLATLIGNDANKSARTIAQEEIASQLATAPEAFDTLLEMAEWLGNHSTDAVDMDNRITANENKLAGIGGEDQPATVLAAIEAAAYELNEFGEGTLGGIRGATYIQGETLDEKIAKPNMVYAEAGEGMIKAVSTDTLVNGVNELVLFGGNAGVAAEA